MMSEQKRGQKPDDPHPEILNPQEDNTEGEQFFFLSKPDDIDSLPPTETSIHLSGQAMYAHCVLERIIKRCPQLNLIRIVKSREGFLSAASKELLADRNIKVIVGRQLHRPYYDASESNRKSHEEEKVKFHTLLQNLDDERKQELEIMRDYEFDEYIFSMLYYSDHKLSMTQIANERGIVFGSVRQKIYTFKVWLRMVDGLTDEKRIGIVEHLLRRVKPYLNEMLKEKNYAEERERYTFNGITPPETLDQLHWPVWFELMKFIEKNKHAYQDFCRNYPREKYLIFKYYQIDEHRGISITAKDLGKEIGLTGERIRQIIAKGLGRLRIDRPRTSAIKAERHKQ